MSSYLFIKYIHITAAIFSISGFLLRAYWRFLSTHKLNNKFVKFIPHINDTILIISAITLTTYIKQYPLTDQWLTAKLTLLITYIITGYIALKTKFTKTQSLIALVIALVSFTAIVLIAVKHS